MAEMILQVFDPAKWDLRFNGTPYDILPKKCANLKTWAEGKAVASNLCYFNFASAKYGPLYTLQTLYVNEALCGKGDASTDILVTLPNGDRVAGWNENKKKPKDPLIYVDKIITPESLNRSSHSIFGSLANGSYFVAKSSKGWTQTQLAAKALSEIVNYHRTNILIGLDMDGGGSTGIYSGYSGNLYAPQKEGRDGRPVTSAFIAKLKPEGMAVRRLWQGMVGEDVKILQIALGSIDADGIFGNITKNRVKQYQREKRLEVDGIAGPITLASLDIWKG